MTPIKLDDRDIKILAILSREGRISKSDLAKRVNLSATPCWERLSRLEKASPTATATASSTPSPGSTA
jgi:Lrp/AsnC family transcriptional regulator of ectoine degradation